MSIVLTQILNRQYSPRQEPLTLDSVIDKADIKSTLVSEIAIDPSIPETMYPSIVHTYNRDNNQLTDPIPQYLVGWEYYGAHEVLTRLPELDENLASTGIYDYFSEDGNLDVYYVQGNTRLIRVIVICTETLRENLTATVSMSAQTSYSNNDLHPLTSNFKNIYDSSTVSEYDSSYDHSNGEIGSGDGSPGYYGENAYRKYFGVKDGEQQVTIKVSLSVPGFTITDSSLDTHNNTAYVVDGLYNSFNRAQTDNPTPLNFQWQDDYNTGTAVIKSIESDKTIFALVGKRSFLVQGIATPPGAADMVVITSDNTQHNDNAYVEYNDTCTIKYTNLLPGWSFNGWFNGDAQIIDGGNYTIIDNDELRINSVTRDMVITASFAQDNQYTISVAANPSAFGIAYIGNDTHNNSQPFSNGATCVCHARSTNENNYEFMNWAEGNEIISEDPVYTFTVNRSRTLVANFGQIKYTIFYQKENIHN